MNTEQRPAPGAKPVPTRGEARIRRALLVSLAALAVGVVLAGVGYLLTRPPASVPVAEAEIALPQVAPAPEAPGAAAAPTTPPTVLFTDITQAAGIDFVHENGAYGERLMPETLGSGAAFFDYDRDGDQDLLLVNSREWPGHETLPEQPTMRLYRNDGSGSFEDATAGSGLDFADYGMGVAIGDVDGDGWDDVYLTSLNANRLLRNLPAPGGGRRFEDITDAAGVAGRDDAWSSSAVFFDYDKDGDLDLFVVNYVKWSRDIDLAIDFRLTGLGRAYGAPVNFIGTDNLLYRNDGLGDDGNPRFTDVSAAAGIRVADPVTGNPVGKGLGVVALDYDGDGWQDLVVVNDTVRNFLFRNLGDGRFEETAILDGVAYDRNGKGTSAMGVDTAHFRNDAELGIAVGNFANEMASLFVTTDGRPPFVDEAVLEGLGPASRIPLTFGLLFFDYDLDGREDLLLANGHLEHEIDKVQQSQRYAQPAALFWNCGDACGASFVFVPPTPAAVGDLAQDLVGRGIAYADIDGDGDLDVLITQNGRRPALLRNDQALGHHWLRLALIGRPPNTGAIGARIELTAGGTTQVRDVRPTRGYLSQVERPVTFGLGALADPAAVSIRVIWPDGSEQTHTPTALDTTLTLRQGGGDA
ncbi:CRTAC1 family protein [Thiohalocapsa sp. ML1]|uniref:CRTAC1 family protein n=1 Tax=Thiohalocapsa sp. ML1 TaxID=1431688 RepID=UPI0007320621|nr:CRTAC1 family protein [Thiohalocapsa sp. ML1]